MGKHKKHRRRATEENNVNANSNNVNTNSNNNLMEMLNNIDKEQISSLLSSMNLGNINLDGNNSNEFDSNEDNSNETNNVNNIDNSDKTVQILNAIKPMVNAERGEIIDRLIQLYAISRIIKK